MCKNSVPIANTQKNAAILNRIGLKGETSVLLAKSVCIVYAAVCFSLNANDVL